MYAVKISDNAMREYKKLDKNQAKIILSWIKKNLVNIENPRAIGKPLKGIKNAWRYRVGNYRLIAEIYDDRMVILRIAIGHRREIYKRF